MQIQPNFTAKYKYSKNEEERKYNVLKDYYKSAAALVCASGTYSVLESINKNSIAKNKSVISADDFKQLAKKGLKRNALIGLAAGIAGYIAAMPLFEQLAPKKEKTDEKYNVMKNFYKAAEGVSTGFIACGVLETIQKFSIAKNKNTKTADEIASLAKKGYKLNIILGLSAAAIGYLLAWPSFKIFEPTQMKLQEWADKQNRIAEKAEELIKQEDAIKNAAVETSQKPTPTSFSLLKS